MKDKVIFLTGGAGFIGTKVAERLIDQNKIVIYDSFKRNSIKYSSIVNHPNLTVVEGDILDLENLKDVLDKFNPTHVIHLAAIAGIDTVIQHPVDTLKVNVIGTFNILEALKLHASTLERFIDISTSEVFGAYSFKSSEQATTNLAPVGEARWTYSISKLMGEHFAHSYHKEYGIKSVSIRPFNIYGPGQVGEGAIHQFVKRAINDEDIEIHGDGDQIRSWCYVDDFVDALLICLEDEKAIGNTFNIGNPRGTITISMLAKLIKNIAQSNSKICYVPKNYADVELRIPSIERAKEDIAFMPKVELEEGLEQTIAWYRNNQV